MSNILIIYHYYGQYPPRATKWAHLFAFKKYAGHRCYYLNLAFQGVPWHLKYVRFDLIVFHTLFFSLRWKRNAFQRYMEKARPLQQISGTKIALPQDEFINTDLVCDFINEFGIASVFSVAPQSEWPKIYPTVDRQKVKFFNVLTGYLDDETITRVNQLVTANSARLIDIGYRTGQPDPTLGRHGFLKGEIAQVFQTKVLQTKLVADISNRPEDILLGDEWYKFLLRCKYTIGVESGSSILDQDGTLRVRILAYVAGHPQASFEEIRGACFPNDDGGLSLSVIGPRHLEACLTKTCQVLIEGTYNGILLPGRHYIELKRDYSNIDQVLQIMQQDQQRAAMTEQAYWDIVASGQYGYQSFVNFVIQNALEQPSWNKLTEPSSTGENLIYIWMRFTDALGWKVLALLSANYRLMNRLLPVSAIKWVKSRLVKWFL